MYKCASCVCVCVLLGGHNIDLNIKTSLSLSLSITAERAIIGKLLPVVFMTFSLFGVGRIGSTESYSNICATGTHPVEIKRN